MDLIKLKELSDVTGYSTQHVRRICRENGVEKSSVDGKTNFPISEFFDAARGMGCIFPVIKNDLEYQYDNDLFEQLFDECISRAYAKIGVIPPSESDEEEDADNLTLTDAKTEKEKWLAKMAKLKYLEANKQSIDVGEVKRGWVDIARRVRASMQLIPGRLAMTLSGESDPFEIENLLIREIENSLNALGEVKTNGAP